MIETPLDEQARRECDHKVEWLRRPETYPERPHRVEAIQTHMSWVFLTDQHAYKLKKPVRYEFLDFSSLEARRRDCEEEVRLNRRLAGEVYLGTVPLTVDAGGRVLLGGAGEVLEWLVRMRRLPAQRMLDALIVHAALREYDVCAVARLLADFFRANTVMELDGVHYRAWLAETIQADCGILVEDGYGLPVALVESVRRAQLALLVEQPTLFDQRTQGWIVEGHGDLRPEHICLDESGPVIFDCLEFNRRFRIVDAADELAFLALECERHGAAFVGPLLFRNYAGVSGDRPPRRLIDFYKTYRACLRAKLALWHLHEPGTGDPSKWLGRAREYLDLAVKYRPRS